jgi:hypothetical protein
MFLQSGILVKIACHRSFLAGIVLRLPWLVGIGIACAIVTTAPRPGFTKTVENSPLLALATRKFHTLTAAERALLVFADKNNLARGQFAIAGISAEPLDPSNDPDQADEWLHDRDIRAGLIRWLAIDNIATTLVDPTGVRVLGARIVGPIDLALLRFPFRAHAGAMLDSRGNESGIGRLSPSQFKWQPHQQN